MRYHELIEGHEGAFHQATRFKSKECFLSYVDCLRRKDLTDNPKIGAGIKLMMFIDALKSHSNADMERFWQSSPSTISHALHEVADCILETESDFVKVPEANYHANYISSNPKFSPFFDMCIGPLDGSHIPAFIENTEIKNLFQTNRHGISQNVLAACDFDLIFKYVLAGWEGSAHDGKLLEYALEHGFPQYAGRFWLCDAGFALSLGFLVPYRGVRYHLKE